MCPQTDFMVKLMFSFSLLFLQGQEHLKVEQESESPNAEEVLGSYSDLKVKQGGGLRTNV